MAAIVSTCRPGNNRGSFSVGGRTRRKKDDCPQVKGNADVIERVKLHSESELVYPGGLGAVHAPLSFEDSN